MIAKGPTVEGLICLLFGVWVESIQMDWTDQWELEDDQNGGHAFDVSLLHEWM